MATRTLPLELMHRVGLKNAEEAEIVDPPQILNQKIEFLLLGEQFLVVLLIFVLNHAFLFFLSFLGSISVHIATIVCCGGLRGWCKWLQVTSVCKLLNSLLNERNAKVLVAELIV